MVKITFPDGSVREYEQGVTGYQIAESISPALARDVVSCGVNGVTTELNRPINGDATIALYKFDDEEGKHTFWHTSAHLLAEALQELYPGIQFGFGPAVENGFFYDVMPAAGQTISENDFPRIEEKMRELAKKNEPVVRHDVSKADAIKEFTADGQEYKVEHIEQDLEDGTISTYTQGHFTDLCRGPHLVSTGAIKAIKITSVAGAFWRGDAKREQMTRIYGITFPKKKMLDEYLVMLEEAKKRDHRKIGKEMELFMFSDRVGKGLPIWLPKGTQLRLRLQDLLRRLLRPYNYQEVITPGIGGKNLYVTSGHYAHYGKDSFQPIHTPEEDEEYMLKPMNCPHHCEVYAYKPRSYKDLPLRIAEFGTVFRYEKSGELHGLTRVRTFTQDDAHIFVRPEQVKTEFETNIDIILKVFKTFGFDNYEAQISLRDPNDKEKYIGSDEVWEESEAAIKQACEEKGLKARVELGEAAFYGPKLDIQYKNVYGKEDTLVTIQIDMLLAERFGMYYIDENGEKKLPYIIHRTSLGCYERTLAYLIEEYAGALPTWMAPEQVRFLPVTDRAADYCAEQARTLENAGFRVEVDYRNEKIGRKIRDAQMEKVPYMVVVGDRDMENGTVSPRHRADGDLGAMSMDEFSALLKQVVDNKEKK